MPRMPMDVELKGLECNRPGISGARCLEWQWIWNFWSAVPRMPMDLESLWSAVPTMAMDLESLERGA